MREEGPEGSGSVSGWDEGKNSNGHFQSQETHDPGDWDPASFHDMGRPCQV